MARIDELNHIDVKQATKLRKAGIRTTEALLKRAGTRAGRDELAEATGIAAEMIWAWVSRADLMRVRGVGSEYAELLEACGVSTIRDLRRRNGRALLARMVALNDGHRRVRRLPTESMVVGWIEAAQKLEFAGRP
jgi:predicted RecB family nuclease